MQRFPRFLFLGLVLIGAASLVLAQPGREQPKGATTVDAFVARLMAFDKNGDGELNKAEMTDERLLRIFERADANKDGIVTKAELVALATQELAVGGQPPGGGFLQKDEGKDKGGFQKDEGKDKGPQKDTAPKDKGFKDFPK